MHVGSVTFCDHMTLSSSVFEVMTTHGHFELLCDEHSDGCSSSSNIDVAVSARRTA